jgi:Flp pilus assembly protein TadG
MTQDKKRRESGHALVEIALLSPWIFLLFMAIFDFGFYSYAAIATANSARVAALYTAGSPSSANDSAAACARVLEEMRALPNVGAATACGACMPGTECTAGPIQVTATLLDPGADGAPASRVTVVYQTINLFPLPWLPGQMTITRQTQMRIKG